MVTQKKKSFWITAVYHERVYPQIGIEEIKPSRIYEPQCVLATSEEQARIMAARLVPEELVEKMDDVEILVSPF